MATQPVVDTRDGTGARGMRSGPSLDDRVLYATEHAWIELLVPRRVRRRNESESIVGHVLPRGEAASASPPAYQFSVELDDGRRHIVWADEQGEFTIPVDGATPFRVRCQPSDGPESILDFRGATRE